MLISFHIKSFDRLSSPDTGVTELLDPLLARELGLKTKEHKNNARLAWHYSALKTNTYPPQERGSMTPPIYPTVSRTHPHSA